MDSSGDILFGYLTYINENNKHYRFDQFKTSILSFKHFLETFDSIVIDNNSICEVTKQLDSIKFKKRFYLKRNLFDISLFYITLLEAKRLNKKYVAFLYDDFICNEDAIEMMKSTIKFMDINEHISCTRLTSFSLKNKNSYNSEVVSKSKNPDSVRFYNTITNEKLLWSEDIVVNNHTFSTTNFHYTSRPCIWRTSQFEVLFDELEEIPILQGFESYACKKFQTLNSNVGVIDIGLMKTTDVKNSARTNELKLDKEMNIKISKNDLLKEYECGK